MGKAIFVSYKYSDANVFQLPDVIGTTTARHYVDKLAGLLEQGDYLYKGEDDGESMETLQDSTIASKLGDKIFRSSVTIVLISKGMKTDALADKDQWIPWEISYSLKEQSREGGNSKTNAVLAVVLPDELASYSYYITENPLCNSITYHTNTLFQILRLNMFNHKKKEDNIRHCNGQKIYEGSPSFIPSVKWENFKNSIDYYIGLAVTTRQNINEYDLVKTV
ncbi:MAG: TIR domain-containing protein [Chitinophagaceae bacterium]|nr:TIR domain-containing protein [Chitinophagaceae bacterium]